jgi:hypothetical protein
MLFMLPPAYVSADVRWSVVITARLVPAGAYREQWTRGFHMANMPAGLCFQIQACSE